MCCEQNGGGILEVRTRRYGSRKRGGREEMCLMRLECVTKKYSVRYDQGAKWGDRAERG